MGRSPCCSKDSILNRGAWTTQEDMILKEYIAIHGEGGWRYLPPKAGLKRCGKSCRLRWLNYLRPDIKRGDISPDEEDLIIRLHRLLGNRWSLIAGRLPSRTDNEIKNYWNTHLNKKSVAEKETLPKPQYTKSKAPPPAGHRVFKSSAVRIAKSRNKYEDGVCSVHQELRRTDDNAETVKIYNSRCESSLVDELMKEGDYASCIDFTMAMSNVESDRSSAMEMNGQYSLPCIPNLVDCKIPHLLSSPEFDLLSSPWDFPKGFGIQELEAIPSSEMEQELQNNMQQVKNFTANDHQATEEIYNGSIEQEGDWVNELQCLQKSSLQWLSQLLLESEEDLEGEVANFL